MEFLNNFKNNVVFMIKFGEVENLKKLQKGELYCKNLKFYSDQERKTGDKSMGDIIEGKYRLTQCCIDCYDKETKKLYYRYKDKTVLISVEDIEKMPVFCITGIKVEDLTFKKEDESTVSCNLKFSNILEKMYSESYWNSGLIITNMSAFIDRVIKSCKNEGIEIQRRPVNYTDMDKNCLDRIQDIDKNLNNIAFWKDESYSYQYEYSIAFENKVVDDNFILDIGDISDISKLYNKKELLDFMNREHTVQIKKEIL
ncbi:hypothetical protein [Clostridium perfringens]|uniref:hypothetical protein n=1 Tax=Clostridium perfringens TaxID=1502 RepID=UPI001C86633F|nr:hypothetical protein [Clostridium perfringens]